VQKVTISKRIITDLYRTLVSIRKTEECLREAFAAGKIPGFIHLYIGQEAVATGVCANLNSDDYVVSTHRGHGHFIAKGAEIKKVVAEIFGKDTGLCGGRGGSLHMTDNTKGLYGTTGIVGGGLPAAAGLALAAKTKKTGQVSVCFFGDGAVNEGTFHETVNLAAIWDLPVIFVCENNLYAQSTPQEYHQKVKDIASRAEGYGIPGISVDGMDVFEVYQAAEEAVARARSGDGPTLLECKTYLFVGHYEGDARAYRFPEEMEYYQKEKDCLNIFTERVLEKSLLSQAEMDKISSQVDREVEEAVLFAENSPYPEPSDLLKHVYKQY